jgi:Protein of unknown function (DUF3467).
MDKPKDNNIDIDLPQDIANGVYSNLQVITHSNTEFILDFVQVMPGVPKAQVRSRVILAPEHAKRLLNALTENINKYEDQNGLIDDKAQIPTYQLGPMGQA